MTPQNGATQEKEKQKEAPGMTRQDAGKLGGLKTAKTHGSEFYRKIGRVGGKARGVKN